MKTLYNTFFFKFSLCFLLLFSISILLKCNDLDSNFKINENPPIRIPKNILYLEYLGNSYSLISLNYEFLRKDSIKLIFGINNAKSYTKIGLGFDFFTSSRQSLLIQQNIILGKNKDFLELSLGAFYSIVKRNIDSDQFVMLEGLFITSNISFRYQNFSNESHRFLKFGICPIYSFKLKELNFSPSISWGIIF
jgi:hypothetical protein